MIEKILLVIFLASISAFLSNYIYYMYDRKYNLSKKMENMKNMRKSKDLNELAEFLDEYYEYFKIVMQPLFLSTLVSISIFVIIVLFFSSIKIFEIPSSIPYIGGKYFTGLYLYILTALISSLLFKKYGKMRNM